MRCQLRQAMGQMSHSQARNGSSGDAGQGPWGQAAAISRIRPRFRLPHCVALLGCAGSRGALDSELSGAPGTGLAFQGSLRLGPNQGEATEREMTPTPTPSQPASVLKRLGPLCAPHWPRASLPLPLGPLGPAGRWPPGRPASPPAPAGSCPSGCPSLPVDTGGCCVRGGAGGKSHVLLMQTSELPEDAPHQGGSRGSRGPISCAPAPCPALSLGRPRSRSFRPNVASRKQMALPEEQMGEAGAEETPAPGDGSAHPGRGPSLSRPGTRPPAPGPGGLRQHSPQQPQGPSGFSELPSSPLSPSRPHHDGTNSPTGFPGNQEAERQ